MRSESPLTQRAYKSIASGTLTYSKQPKRYVEGVYPDYVTHGSGPYLFDRTGSTYIDFICGLGVNILGYAHPAVNEAVKRQISDGVLFSLPHRSEIELAEKIKSMTPSIELLRFLKSGSEAVSAAVKIARAFTNKDVVFSYGYHGWHDWSTPLTANRAGTPKSFDNSIVSIGYNDIAELEDKFSVYKGRVACVVIDPYVFDQPADDYFSKLIKLSRKYGALVIFDEVVTGFRWTKFSVQNAYNVRPDLTCFGKTLANGFPMSVVGGRKDVMQVLDDKCFVSSTYGGDLVGIAGALATLDIIHSENVPDELYDTGRLLMDGLNEIALTYGLDYLCDGSPLRQRMNFPSNDHKALFWQECVKMGVMFGGAQHTSYAHKSEIIDHALTLVDEAAKKCKVYWGNPKDGLEGNPPEAVLAISNLRK